MQRTLSEMDIDGHVVHTGAAVQVKWLGIWYEGTVVKIGHKRNLYRVRDELSKETVLLDSKHLQPIEAFVMDKRISVGIHVAYKDGDQWKKGVVDSNSTFGVMMVSWRKTCLSKENLNWFELSHIAPVIHNELYNEHNRDRLEAGKSGLLFNDAIEPRPHTIDNMLYESESDNDMEILNELAKNKASPSISTMKQPEKTVDKDDLKEHTQEDQKAATAPFPALPVPLPTLPFLPAPMFISYPPMMHSYGNMFLQSDQNHYMKMAPSFMNSSATFQSTLPHPHSLRKPGLSHSSVPCIMSCTKSTNGIPPHPSSKFFRNIRSAKQRVQRKAGSKKSESKACSEPTDYATIAEVLEPLTEQLAKAPQHLAEQAVEPYKTQPSLHSSELRNVTLTPNQAQLQSSSKGDPRKGLEKGHLQTVPPPLPPRPQNPPKKPTTVTIKQPLPSSNHWSLKKRDHYLPITDGKGDVVVDEMESEEENEKRFIDEESEQGATLALVSASPAHVSVPHGGATLLTCVVRGSHNVNYKWTRDGKPISEHDPFFTQPAPGMLQIKMASLYLTGEYKCVASVNHSSLERVFHLTVTSETQASDDQQSTNVATESPLKDEEFSREMSPDTHTTMVEKATSLKSRPEVPIIVINEPPPEYSMSMHPVSPESLAQSGRDTPDVTDSRIGRNDTEKAVAMEGESEDTRRRAAKRNRRRVSSSALKNDMEQYLEGYGENYGQQSSKVLEPCMEGFSGDMKKRRGKKRRKKTQKSSSEGSSPTKGTLKKQDSPKESKKNVKLQSSPLGKRKKKKVDIEEAPLSKSWQRKPVHKITKDSSAELDEEEANSVAVQTSVGASSGSEVSLRVGEKEERREDTLELPQEQESLNDSVRRLQLSVEEYCPEQLQFAEKEKKTGFLSSIFTKNKMY